jgi:hypothetical protein
MGSSRIYIERLSENWFGVRRVEDVLSDGTHDDVARVLFRALCESLGTPA